MARSMQVYVPNTPHAVAKARQVIADSLVAWGIARSQRDEAIVGDLLLVATELLSNAVKFSSGEVVLALTWSGSVVRVGVTDTASSPAIPRTAGLEAGGGRGLAIVAALSRRWGQSRYAGGRKEVWAEVAIGTRADAGASGGTITTVTLEG